MSKSPIFAVLIVPSVFLLACSKSECVVPQCPSSQSCCGIGLIDSKASSDGKAIYERYMCSMESNCKSDDKRYKFGAVPLKQGDCRADSVDMGWSIGTDPECDSNARRGKSFTFDWPQFGN